MSELDLLYLKIKAAFKPPPQTFIKIKIGDKVVGAVQSLTISEFSPVNITSSREIETIPHPYSHVTAKVSRLRFDKLRVSEAFNRGFFSVQTQRYPFDIIIDDNKAETTVKNAWITDCKNTYHTADWVIAEGIDLEAEYVSSKKK